MFNISPSLKKSRSKLPSESETLFPNRKKNTKSNKTFVKNKNVFWNDLPEFDDINDPSNRDLSVLFCCNSFKDMNTDVSNIDITYNYKEEDFTNIFIKDIYDFLDLKNNETILTNISNDWKINLLDYNLTIKQLLLKSNINFNNLSYKFSIELKSRIFNYFNSMYNIEFLENKINNFWEFLLLLFYYLIDSFENEDYFEINNFFITLCSCYNILCKKYIYVYTNILKYKFNNIRIKHNISLKFDENTKSYYLSFISN